MRSKFIARWLLACSVFVGATTASVASSIAPITGGAHGWAFAAPDAAHLASYGYDVVMTQLGWYFLAAPAPARRQARAAAASDRAQG